MTQVLQPTAVSVPISSALATSPIVLNGSPRSLAIQANFSPGASASGSSIDVYVQTTIDDGSTWADVVNFHFTTVARIAAVNITPQSPVGTPLSSATAPDAQTPVTLTDGTMASNTARDGLLGPQIRAKYLSTGTYSGASIRVDVASVDLGSY